MHVHYWEIWHLHVYKLGFVSTNNSEDWEMFLFCFQLPRHVYKLTKLLSRYDLDMIFTVSTNFHPKQIMYIHTQFHNLCNITNEKWQQQHYRGGWRIRVKSTPIQPQHVYIHTDTCTHPTDKKCHPKTWSLNPPTHPRTTPTTDRKSSILIEFNFPSILTSIHPSIHHQLLNLDTLFKRTGAKKAGVRFLFVWLVLVTRVPLVIHPAKPG